MLFKLYRKEDVAGGFFSPSEDLPSAFPPRGAWPGLNTQSGPRNKNRVCSNLITPLIISLLVSGNLHLFPGEIQAPEIQQRVHLP